MNWNQISRMARTKGREEKTEVLIFTSAKMRKNFTLPISVGLYWLNHIY